MTNKTVIKIVQEYLEVNNFGGLYQPDIPCGCELGDLAPCAGDIAMCQPGYKHFDPRPDGTDWAIFSKKEPPDLEDWERVEF